MVVRYLDLAQWRLQHQGEGVHRKLSIHISQGGASKQIINCTHYKYRSRKQVVNLVVSMLRLATTTLLRPRASAAGAVSLLPCPSLLSRLGLLGGHSWRSLCSSSDGATAPPALPLRWRNVPPPVGYMSRAEPITMAHVGHS